MDLSLVSECNLTMKEQLTEVDSTRKLLKCLDTELCCSSGFDGRQGLIYLGVVTGKHL